MNLAQKLAGAGLFALTILLAGGAYIVGNNGGYQKGRQVGITEQKERVKNNFYSYQLRDTEEWDTCIKRGKYKVLTDRCDRVLESQKEEIRACERMAEFPYKKENNSKKK